MTASGSMGPFGQAELVREMIGGPAARRRARGDAAGRGSGES